MTDVPLHLYDPRLGEPALTVDSFSAESIPPRKSNCFTIMWIQEGEGTFWADLAEYPFEARSVLFFTPYQTLKLCPAQPAAGHRIQFHANFFCIETYHDEVGCNGVLFNDLYGVPMVRMDAEFEQEFGTLVDAMRRELRENALAHTEVLVSYLKIMLVRATRIKLQQQAIAWSPQEKRPAVLDALRELLEANYRTLHKPSDYAARLCLTPKSLARLVKAHFRLTPTELIRERIMRQAKWELLHTLKPVKQVAYELGFHDVYYFSRLFKRATGCSPTFFREYETEIRGGRNLSINESASSIPDQRTSRDHGGEPSPKK